MKKILSFIVALVMSVTMMMAQQTVKGTVISSEDGETVIGAAVMVKGTQVGTVTDIDGKFSINMPAKTNTLVISYLGMTTKEVVVKGNKPLSITLDPEASQIEEVVVTGMGKMDKRLFTGATTKVDAAKMKMDGVTDVSRSLEGRVAGVSVQNVSGTFGTAPKIRVRGATSIYGSSSPLWVVDGVILEGSVNVSAEELSSGDAETLISNAIAGLNADDIESFQVLKDGSATSIYGARAMAGVIVITTKKGRAGSATINYTGEFTYRMKPSYSNYNISNSQEQMGIYKEMEAKGWLEFANLANSSTSGLYGGIYRKMNEWNDATGSFNLPNTEAALARELQNAEYRNTDWFDLLFKNNLMQNHSVSIATGTDKANLYASISAMNDPGWSLGQNVARYTANLTANYNLSKKVALTVRSNAMYRDQMAPGTLNQSMDVVSGAVNRSFDINPFSYALNTSRTLDPNGNYRRNYTDFNIFDELNNNYIDLKETDVKFQGELSIKPVRGLEVRLLGSYRIDRVDREHFVLDNSNQANAYRAGVDDPNVMFSNKYLYTDPDKPNSLPVSVMPSGGIYTLRRNSVEQLDFRGTLEYNNIWGEEAHIFNFIAVFEANRADREAYQHTDYGVEYDNGRTVVITPDLFKQMKEEGTVPTAFGRSWNRRLAYAANANYSYKGRYSLNLTGRYDGSNQLGKATSSRWLPTYNVSASWNAHEESFFKTFVDKTNGAISHGTIRFSYSLTGEQTTASNAYPIFVASEVWRPQANQQEVGIELSQLGNSDLTFEKKYEYNLGVDLGFFKNRINVVTDIYWRDNFDLMGYMNTEGAGGELRKFANVASMRSHGWEATISSKNISTPKFTWTMDLTGSYTKTTITDLLSQTRVIDLVQSYGAARVGYDHRSLFSIPFVRLSDEGIPVVINENGEETSTDINFQEYQKLDFMKYEGSTEPMYTGGLNNAFRYGNWHLNVFFTYSFGSKIRLDPVFSASYSDMSAMPKEFKNRWVMPGDEKKTNIPTIASYRQVKDDNYLGYAYSAYNYSTERVADGGFIRLKDVSLSYDMPKDWIRKIGLNSLSLKIDATNLCLLYADDKLNGQDPEFVNAGGVAMPLSKQFTFTLRMGI